MSILVKIKIYSGFIEIIKKHFQGAYSNHDIVKFFNENINKTYKISNFVDQV